MDKQIKTSVCGQLSPVSAENLIFEMFCSTFNPLLDKFSLDNTHQGENP